MPFTVGWRVASSVSQSAMSESVPQQGAGGPIRSDGGKGEGGKGDSGGPYGKGGGKGDKGGKGGKGGKGKGGGGRWGGGRGMKLDRAKNDFSQHFVDSRQRPANFIRDSNLTDRFDEYPKLKELIEAKDERIATRASPAMFKKVDLRSFDLTTLGTKFDVVLIDPPWEEYRRRAAAAGGLEDEDDAQVCTVAMPAVPRCQGVDVPTAAVLGARHGRCGAPRTSCRCASRRSRKPLPSASSGAARDRGLSGVATASRSGTLSIRYLYAASASQPHPHRSPLTSHPSPSPSSSPSPSPHP